MRRPLITISLLLMATPATAQLRITEVLFDPIGPNPGRQLVELVNESNRPLALGGWSVTTAGTAVALPALALPVDQVLRVHVGASGASTPADLYLPGLPELAASGTFTVIDRTNPAEPDRVVDFVSWGGGRDGIEAAVAAGQWPSTLVSVARPPDEGSSIAHFGAAAFDTQDEPSAWYADRTPTLGLLNDVGSIFNREIGCPSYADLPWVGLARPQSRPWLGEAFWLDVHNVPSSVPIAGLVIGASLTPPRPLDALGMRGCAAYVALDVVEGVALFGGSGIWSATVPNDPSLVRGCFYAQAFTVYPGAPNPAQALVSNVVAMTIGSH